MTFTSLASCPKGFPLRSGELEDQLYVFPVFPKSERPPEPPPLRAPPPCPPPHSPSPSGPCLSALALVDEEDTGEGIREPTAVSSKEASGLIHVGSELEDLLLCGKEWAEPCHTAPVALWGYKLGEWPTQDEESSLTGVDQADWRKGVQTQALGCFDLLEATGQATQEVLPLLTEAQPQVELQLGLDCPTCRAKAPLPWQLGGRIGVTKRLTASRAHRVREAQGGSEASGRVRQSCACPFTV